MLIQVRMYTLLGLTGIVRVKILLIWSDPNSCFCEQSMSDVSFQRSSTGGVQFPIEFCQHCLTILAKTMVSTFLQEHFDQVN